MPAGMPVLRQHHMRKPAGKRIEQRDDLFAARHRERPTRAEVVLHVDDQQNVVASRLETNRHRITTLAYCSRSDMAVEAINSHGASARRMFVHPADNCLSFASARCAAGRAPMRVA